MKRPVITGTERERKDWKANSTTALYFVLSQMINNRLRGRFESDNDTTIEKKLYTRCINKTTNEQEPKYFKQSINRSTDHGNKVEVKFNATLKQVFLHLRIKETQ